MVIFFSPHNSFKISYIAVSSKLQEKVTDMRAWCKLVNVYAALGGER